MVVFGPGSYEIASVSDPFGLGLSKPGRYISAVRAELVEAVACGFGGRARVGVGGRESPGVRVTFFCFAKRKSPKKRRPPVCDPCASLRGKPASCRLRGAPWNSLCAARAARTATASQSTKHGRFDAHATPQPPRLRRSQQVVGQPNNHTCHRFARPRLRSAWRLRPQEGAERSAAEQWPVWMSDPFGFPSGCAEERSGQRIRARDCLSATQWSEFERDPAGREHRRLPAAKRRDAACRVAFSLVTFFWRSKRKPLRRRAHTPASTLSKSTPPQPAHKPRLKQTQPNRLVSIRML